MKEDVPPPPPRPPRKRRALEQVHDQWIAIWLNGDAELTPSDRRRLEEEKKRRKQRQPPVSIGYIGSGAGMTPGQRRAIYGYLNDLDVPALIEQSKLEAHHGDGVGGDEQFDEICENLHIPVIVHPPVDNRLRAWCKGMREEKAKPNLERNKEIVRACTVLLVTPKESREPAQAPGSWGAVRYARQRGRVHHVIMPDGTTLEPTKERVA